MHNKRIWLKKNPNMFPLKSIQFAAYFILSVIAPFYSKELLKYSNFPFFNTFLINLFYLPIAFITTWATSGSLPFNNWTAPPPRGIWLVVLLSITNSLSISLTFVCYSISQIDFVAIFSLSSVIFEAIFLLILFRTRISIFAWFGLLTIFGGLIMTMVSFECLNVHGKIAEILFILGASFFSSYSRLFHKKVTLTLQGVMEFITSSMVNFWNCLFSTLISLLLYLFVESHHAHNISSIVSIDYINLILFGVALLETTRVLGSLLNETNEFAFAESFTHLKVLPILLICTMKLGVKFSLFQLFCIFFSLSGVVIVSITIDKRIKLTLSDSEGDTISLLNREDGVLNKNVLNDEL
ncbi:hypothetical protein TRFO_35105 [Tritrichomonas foetus]|uniref:EamA domain-containing protein n=1 Tax=Tritrichomonas foetus TaxID=1144522 RepID=A0A1J4JH62_9EUKA|nr:hypothetical protein TRFO_35105 [Tritrichomonas foetus]|eukprot:OHS98478.1 hypothetical protein TRFO_35105 [Tritrichomonas foetus]